MRLATLRVGSETVPALLVGDTYVELARRLGSGLRDVGDLIVGGYLDEAVAFADASPDGLVTDISWLPPVVRPAHIFCVGLNYDRHRAETGRAATEHPTIFLRAASSQIGHLAPIVLPRVSRQLDFEGELAVVIGKGGRYIEPADAFDHIAGVACYDDVSVRDFQRHSTQWIPGKNFPGTGAFGPALVTLDELDLDVAELRTLVNGTVMQQAKLSEMVFPIPELIAYVSMFCVLEPGDVIATGTPGGVGMHRDPPLFLAPGDVVEVQVDGVGELRNTVESE